MWETVKSALILILVLAVVFIGGVLVGLKLPETAFWQQWQRERNAARKPLGPVDVAVIQFPGGSGKGCGNGVCPVAPSLPRAAESPAVPPPEKKPKYTFYRELGDRRPPSSVRPAAAAEKLALLEKKRREERTAVTWEVRVCSLPRETLARLERARLLKKYPRVKIESVDLAGKGTWFRVKIVGIPSRRLAERYLRELRQDGKYKPLIIKHTQG